MGSNKHRSAAKGVKRQKRDAAAKRKRAAAPQWSPARAAIADAYWEQGPDPDQPDRYNLIQARLPSGGRRQPVTLYTGHDVVPRLKRFCSTTLQGMRSGGALREDELEGARTEAARIELAGRRLGDILEHAADVDEFARLVLVAAGTAWARENDRATLPELLRAMRHQIDHSPALNRASPRRH